MTDYKCIVNGHFGSGRTWSWAWHVTSNQTPAALATTWNNAIKDWWQNGTYGINTQMPTTTQCDSTEVVVLNGLMDYSQKTPLETVGLPGTSADNGMPDKDSMVGSLRSPFPGKHQRGRTKLPAMVEGIVTNGEFTNPAATRAKNGLQAVYNAITADGSTVFVFNRYPLVDNTPAFTKTVITSIQVALKVGSVRKRTKKAPNPYV